MTSAPKPGEVWTSGAWVRQLAADRRCYQQGPVEVVDVVNRRGERFAVVRDRTTGDTFRVNVDRFGAAGRTGYRLVG